MSKDKDQRGILKVLPTPSKEAKAAEPKPEVVAMIEALLKQAKTGELTGVVVMSYTGGTYGHDFAGLDSMSELLGFNTMCDLVKDHLLSVIGNNAE